MPDAEPLSPSDLDLLARTAAGDDRAFEVFVSRHEAWLLRYTRALAGASAEEVLQDAFVAAWRGAQTFDGGTDGEARPWLMAIARNAHRRMFRLRAGQPASFESLDSLESLEGLARAAGWGSSAGEASRLHTRDVLQRALERLPPDAREVLWLRDLEGWTGEEAAGLLKLTVPALKSRLHRARLQLMAAIRELDHG